MITEIKLENFRGFERHTVPLRQLTIIVGKNNAGKSTIVEALRLISLITNRYQSLNYHPIPQWLDRPRRQRAVVPSREGIEFSPVGIFHRYGDPPARIIATFSSGEEIEVLIGNGLEVVGIIKDSKGTIIHSKGEAMKVNLPQVSILPQIGPLLREENLLVSTYVRQSMTSSRSSLHFRNQLRLLKDHFMGFKQIAQETWPGLAIQELNENQLTPTEISLNLLVRDGDFAAEVGWMGHGLQMWLQTMWFLTYSSKSQGVILDEPDVYMHADLQRRLIRLLRSRAHQTIIATHSVEIMSEVDPEEILVIDRRRTKSYFAAKQPAVQRLLSTLGSIQNIQLARLSSAKRFLMVEGDDVEFLKRFQDTLYPNSQLPLDTIPNKSIGGWSGWERAVGCAELLKETAGETFRCYCILDSDYQTENALEKRQQLAAVDQIELHIWKKKEIENYLLIPGALLRIFQKSAKTTVPLPSVEHILERLDKIAEELRMDVFNAMATAFLEENRSLGLTGANRKADERLQAAWRSTTSKLAVVSGKEVIHRLNEWAKKDLDVSFSAIRLARELSESEIDDEVKSVLAGIEAADSFNQMIAL
jgi:hypothetical protein